ncbi:MAG: agmatine/peptidylarginine deiminase [Vicinamibacterales bacterium]
MSPGSARVLSGTPAEHGYSFPAEWRRHAATWISWPRPEGISFPGFYHRAIEDVVRVVAAIARHEPVRVNVPNANYEYLVRERLAAAGVGGRRLGVHHIATNECWTRDHGPAFVQRTRRGRIDTAVVDWGFNAWGGKYPPWNADDAVPTRVAEVLRLPVFHNPLVMEGGAIDVNGAGTLLTTTSCLLHPNRNGGLPQAEVERHLKAWYGQRHVVWLGKGIAGDDTDGHVDDLARFIGPRTIVTAVEADPADANYRVLRANRRALDRARDADGRTFDVVELPMPRPVVHDGMRLPATYVNFLFVNGGLLVPTFGDRVNDRRALAVLQRALPRRRVTGVDCRALIWGLGAIHCLTQQQPA